MSELSLEAFRAASKRQQGPLCTVEQIRLKLDPESRDALDAALADLSIPGTAITRVLVDRGHEIRDHTVQNHRRGDCRCGKAAS